MAEKLTCPSCGTHTSDVLRAVEHNEPCPSCGLSAAAIVEVTAVKSSRADEAVKARAAKALEDRDRWRARALTAEWRLQEIGDALAARPPASCWARWESNG